MNNTNYYTNTKLNNKNNSNTNSNNTNSSGITNFIDTNFSNSNFNNTNLNSTNNSNDDTNSYNYIEQNDNIITNSYNNIKPNNYDITADSYNINNDIFDNVKVIQANTFADDLIYEYSDEGSIDDSNDDYVELDTDDDYSDIYEASKPIFDAIYNGNIADLLKAIENGTNINQRNAEGFTPLLYAINYDKVEAVKALLSYSNFIDIEMPLNGYTNIYSVKGKNFSGEVLFNGTTPLQYAIFKGNTNIVNLLIDSDADTRKKDYNGYCSLFYASAFSDANMIHFLLTKDPTLTREKSLSGRTVMHFAAIYGNDDAISYYLSNTFLSINAIDNEGNTPLHYASEKGFASTIDLLINSGAKTDIANNAGLLPSDLLKK